MLKKEVASTSEGGVSSEGGDRTGYRQALVKTLHTTSIKFPAVASTVVPLVSICEGVRVCDVCPFSCLSS